MIKAATKSYLPAVIILAILLACLALPTRPVLAAGPFTVNTTADTEDASINGVCADASSQCSLRAAIQEANNFATSTTISVPAGTYNLSLGSLIVAPNGSRTIMINGAGSATTIIQQTDGINRVFDIDSFMLGNTDVTINGVTISGGRDLSDRFGGAGILAGSGNQVSNDRLTLTNSIVTNNHASPPSADFTGQPGGGVQMAGGNLTVTNCTFTNNTSASSQGGAIAYISPEFGGTVTITGSSFSGNGMTNTATSGSTGGGAIYINNALSSPNTTTINNSTFTNNSAAGSALTGTTYGGAIYINTGVLNIDHSTFRGNSSTGNGGQGGAIYVDSGTLSLQYSRLVGNSAPNGGSGVYNHSTNGAATTATNNWWGCNAGPAAAGCDQAAADGAGLTAAPWIVLSNTANPASIYVGEATTLTASFLQNSAGATLSTAQVSLLLGSTVTWNNAVLGSLSAQVLSIQPDGKATATFTAGMVNGAGQATATVDNGAATAGITILPIADLVVTKTSPPSAAVGSNLTYTVSVTNNGPNGAQNVTLTDALPTGTSFVSQSQTGGADLFTLGRSGNTIANTIANLPAGATAMFQFVTNVAANLPDASVLSNTASVSAASRDPNGSNNSSTATTSVFASADLVVTKTSPPAVAAGTDLTYTVSLTNNGPSDARTVTLTDTLPNGTSFVSQSQTGGTDLFTLGRTGNTITNTIANLPAGATVTFQFVTHVSAALPDGGVLSNTASVSAVTDDPNSSNNASTAGTSLDNSADLVVTKTSPPTVVAGTDLTYTVMVTNIGPSMAENVQLSDPLPTGTSFVSQSQTGGADVFTLGRTGNTITNTIASLPAGATATFQIVARVSAAQPAFSMLGNTASIIAATDDPNSNNNSATAPTAVTTSADLVVTKTSPPSVTAGSNLTYTLSVSNNGPSDAASISLTDTLPAETSFVAQSQTGGADLFTLGNIGNTIGNSIASLPAGATATFEILTKVSANRPDASQLSNTAIVSAASFDPNGSNNSSTAGTTVFTSADLAVTKSGPALVTAGGSLTYTVSLTNNGPSDAQGVTLLDTLPTGTAFTSQIQTLGPNFILSNAGNAVQNTIPSLAAGASASFSISASVDSGLAGGSTLTNSATVASTTSDLNPANNSASSAATVNRPPAFTSADSTTFTVGVAGTFTVTASGYPTPSLSLSGALPGGVTFVDNGNGTATLSGMPAAGSGGTYILTLSASNGVGTDAAQTFTLTVYPLPEITSGNATTFTVGMPGTFTVTATGVPTPSLSLSGALPGGVTFVDNGNSTATLSGTPALGTVNAYPLTITAHNTSGVDYNQSFTLTVQKADSAVSVVSLQNPSVFGQMVTFSAVVTSGGGTPTGQVQFSVDGLPIGSPIDLVEGSASLLTASLAAGTHAVSAAYSGDANFNPSNTALPLSQVVNQADTSTAVSVAFGASVFKLPVTIAAVVAPVAPGAGVPSGTLTFMDGATLLGTVDLDAAGTAVLDISSLPRGTHTFTATYNGSGNFAGSTQTNTVLIPYINFMILISK